MEKEKKLTTGTIGDVLQHPVIESLISILNENEYKYSIRCTTLLNKYRLALSKLNIFNKKDKRYYSTLVLNDFIYKLELSKDQGLPEEIYTRMLNLINGINKNFII